MESKLLFIIILFSLVYKGFAITPRDIGINYFKSRDCLNEYGFPARSNWEGYINENCTPDTLYRWENPHSLDFLNNPKSWKLVLSKPIFTSFSPLATYPYGPIPMRYKVKAGVKFRMVGVSMYNPKLMCNYLDREEIKNTIYVRWTKAMWGYYENRVVFFEYDICSYNVFESVSVLQPRAFEEIKRQKEYQDYLIKTNNTKWNTIVYLHFLDGTPLINMPEGLPGQDISLDYLRWDKKVLESRLTPLRLFFQKRRRLIPGTKIYYHPSIRNLPEMVKFQRHFQTNRPIFFNPE